jgi:hypothetical protein
MTNRELATFILLGIGLVFCFTNSKIRESLLDVLRILLGWKIWFPLLVYAIVVSVASYLANQWGFWDRSLIAATILWYVFGGIPIITKVDEVDKRPEILIGVLRSTFGPGALFSFFLGIQVFSLPVELIGQIILIILVCMGVVAQREAKYSSALRVINALWNLAIAYIAIRTIIILVDQWSGDTPRELSESFLFPVWLVVVTIPFLALFTFVASYELAFMRMGFSGQRSDPTLRDKIALVVGLNIHLTDVSSFQGVWGNRIKEASTFMDAVRHARSFREHRQGRIEEERQYQRNLVELAGVNNVDEQGRQLDRREFKETIDALSWIWTCHAGRYVRNNRRYQSDLMTILGSFANRGLPDPHGIVMRVSSDGQIWMAYRQTVTGWIFAVGASGSPPDIWKCDGPEPTNGFPGQAPGWDHMGPRENSPNWV